MRSLVAVVTAVAAIFPLVSAVPEAGTLQLGFQKRKVQASADQLSRRQTSKTINTLLSNELILYLINVTVGTPPQSIGLQLDTGSSDIWFPSSQSSYCRRYQCLGSYNSAASSTYKNPGLGTFKISYVDGTDVSGQYISDTLGISGTSVTNLTMASATQTGQQGYGIMGVSFPDDESSNSGAAPFTYPGFMDVLVSQGKINTRSYSLWLDDLASNTGSILFGGVDKDKYTGNLVAVPVQKDSQTGLYTSFTVPWTGLTITGGGQTSNQNPSSPLPAILDSGTTELYLPTSIVNNIYNGLGVVTDNEYGNIVPCDYANDNLSFNFQFGGSSGPKIVVPLSEFVLPTVNGAGRVPQFRSGPYKGKNVCQIGIQDAGSNPILFGDTFLRSAYVVYDLDNKLVGMAQLNTKATSGTGNVQAFASGSGMPDATATITGVSVAASGTGQNGPQVASSATATGDAGSQATTRTATFSLVATGSSSSSSAASHATLPSIERSTITVLGVIVSAFIFGTMIL